ncbi:MAG: putative peptidoglycan glycosyltransferase FtsW [Candidatus Paceibacterota bacterium]|jgi:cell division protein FtsW
MNRTKRVDVILATLTVLLVTIGFLVFASASMGLLSRGGANYSLVLMKQGAIALAGIVLLFFLATKIHYKFFQHYATGIFFLTLILTILVFIPHIGFSTKGGTRWIDLGFGTIQPSEFLKLGTVLFLAAYYAKIKTHVTSFTKGFLPFLITVAVVGAIILKQPDTGTFLVVVCGATAVFLAAGGRWLHLAIFALAGIILAAGLATVYPHVQDRINTFLNSKQGTLDTSYHLRQSLIAIGSGQIIGRGFGQSVQKFKYLPEPIGDSIFSVFSEDFGFIGSSVLILLFMFYSLRGLRISDRVPDQFGRLLGIGIVILIVSQSYINITALTGIIPLTGVPLVFISQGGTALLMAFIEAGILLQISRHTQ